ncbi:Gfo/Idh/MocA family oxidoreductase [Microbacterium sp. ARD32]|uniref:Gfo/Idh/MocA family protein n=1 Tax=Microbacterium sp. ARD32 TaxID=2962577 RepID=UPI00288187A8|nr:Gfo/Idh/MocA family oxidoreductase [Microbacterium sp. ARD32]MDT0157680.1 Gfo/Idh/MocA family oxidoreductase [Microbacterium sp. ARD32]
MDDTPQVGIVGAGGIAPPHIEGWLALGAEVAILRRTGADALGERYGIRIVDTLDELIAGSGIVDIVSPTSSHLDIALAAFAQRRHVVCEKPLAVTAVDAQAMADAAATAGVRLFPAHVVRYFAGYQQVHEEIGGVGTLLELTFRRTVAAPASAWFFSPDAGGGIIRDLMIHDLDQALWLAGPVAEVSATQDPPTADEPPVSAHVTLTHTGGAISHVRADWAEPGAAFHSSASVVGSAGELSVDTDEVGGAAEGSLPPASAADPYREQLADFLHAIRTGREARVTPADGVAAVVLVDAAYASLEAGRPVRL